MIARADCYNWKHKYAGSELHMTSTIIVLAHVPCVLLSLSPPQAVIFPLYRERCRTENAKWAFFPCRAAQRSHKSSLFTALSIIPHLFWFNQHFGYPSAATIFTPHIVRGVVHSLSCFRGMQVKINVIDLAILSNTKSSMPTPNNYRSRYFTSIYSAHFEI